MVLNLGHDNFKQTFHPVMLCFIADQPVMLLLNTVLDEFLYQLMAGRESREEEKDRSPLSAHNCLYKESSPVS